MAITAALALTAVMLVATPAQALKVVTTGGGVGIAVPGPGGVNEGGNAILTGINKIFVTTNDNVIYRFDGATETPDSSFSIPTPGIYANRLYADQTHNLIYATNSTGAQITAYDGTTGALTRTLATSAGTDFYNRVVIDEANNRVWAAGTVAGNAAGDRSLTAFDSSGAVVFRDDVPTAYSSVYGSPNMAVDQSNGNVFFAYPSSTTLYRIDGTTLAKTTMGALSSTQPVSSMAIDSSLHKLLVSYNDGTVGVYDSASGAYITTFAHGGGGTAYVDATHHVLYTTGNNMQGYSTVDGSTNTNSPTYKTAVQLSVDPGRQQVWFADTTTRANGVSMYLRLAQNEPQITSTVAPGATRGAAYSYQLTASGTPTFTYSVTLGTLPAGLSLDANTGLISGTPTGSSIGSNVQVTATNRAGSGNQSLTITVAYPPAMTTQPSNSTVAAGGTLTVSAAANGSPAPTVQWQQSADSGTTFTPIAGATSSTYTTTMTSGMNGYRYRAVFTNASGSITSNQAVATLMTIPVITPGPPSTVIGTGVSYFNSFGASGGGTMVYTISSGSLPPGLALNSATGLLSGTPTTAGTYPLGITATNAAGTSSVAFTVIVQTPTAPSFTGVATALNAVQGVAYTGSAAVSAGTNVSYSLFSGSLPTGLTLYTGTGGIVGTPTSTGSTFVIRATNGVASVNQTFTVAVNVPPSFASAAPTTATFGTAFSSTPTMLGSGSFVFAVTSGSLPSGLTLNTSTGALSGIPTASGLFAFTVTATGLGGSANQSISLQVNQPPSYVGVASLASSVVGQSYNSSVAVPIGAGVTYAVTAGSLPAGLTLNTGTGAITGSTSVSGSTTFTVTATNAYGAATHQFTLVAAAAPVIVVVTTPKPTATPTPVPTAPPTSAPTPTSTPTPTPSVGATPAPTAAIDFGVAAGADAEGAPIDAKASGLLPGSRWSLTMHSTPVVIASGVVPASGSIAEVVALPASIPTGSHTLIFESTSRSGASIVSRTYFAVTAAKTIAGISTIAPVALPATHSPGSGSGTDAGSGSGANGLATTGFAAMPWLGGASVLLIVGLGLLAFARRRRRQTGTDV